MCTTIPTCCTHVVMVTPTQYVMFPCSVNPANLRVAICYTQCNGHEDKLTHCLLSHCGALYYCSHYEDIAIACSEWPL